MFGLIKKRFIRLLTSLVVNVFSHTKCVSLSNQKCEIQHTFINLHPNKYPFTVTLDRCVGSCNALEGLSNKVCAPNETDI